MNILTINCGSSSLKFALYSVPERAGPVEIAATPSLTGKYAEIGGSEAVLTFSRLDGAGSESVKLGSSVSSHQTAWGDLVRRFFSAGISISAVGHRIVHGGNKFRTTHQLTPAVVEEINGLSSLAPLHNIPAIQTIKAALASFDQIPHFGVFDTAFHSSMPREAKTYPIPLNYFSDHMVERYGFHGLAHRSMLETSAAIAGVSSKAGRVITLQLGAGCSGCAILNGNSIDTSMGFSPLEGLMMATRSGDIDPSVIQYLHRQALIPYDDLFQMLNKKSGLLGVSGLSSNMAQLLKAEEEGDDRAGLAIGMFCRRVTKLIGAYLAILGGADRIVFGGGIGTNAPAIRERILTPLSGLGITFNSTQNRLAVGKNAVISAPGVSPSVIAVEVDEELIIVQEILSAGAA